MQVAVVGSGAWACAATHMLAQNVKERGGPGGEFAADIAMWVYEETFEGRSLPELVNERGENPKYLPGVDLGEGVRATSDLREAVREADIVALCVPHQFMRDVCRQLTGAVKPGAYCDVGENEPC